MKLGHGPANESRGLAAARAPVVRGVPSQPAHARQRGCLQAALPQPAEPAAQAHSSAGPRGWSRCRVAAMTWADGKARSGHARARRHGPSPGLDATFALGSVAADFVALCVRHFWTSAIEHCHRAKYAGKTSRLAGLMLLPQARPPHPAPSPPSRAWPDWRQRRHQPGPHPAPGSGRPGPRAQAGRPGDGAAPMPGCRLHAGYGAWAARRRAS